MSITDQFWQYAKEAMLSAYYAETDDDKQALLDLARTWTQAALLERRSYQLRQPGWPPTLTGRESPPQMAHQSP